MSASNSYAQATFDGNDENTVSYNDNGNGHGSGNGNGHDNGNGNGNGTANGNGTSASARSSAHKVPEHSTQDRNKSRQIPSKYLPIAEETNAKAGATTGSATNGTISDCDYLVTYFPGAKSVYNFDANNNIIGTADAAMNNRKDIKRAVNAHWYFFTYGCEAQEPKSKELAETLASLRPHLSFTTQLIKRVQNSLP